MGDRVQCSHQRGAQLAEQGEDVAAVWTAEDAEFVLQADEIDLVDVQEIRGLEVGRQIAFVKLEADPRRILVTLLAVVHRDSKTACLRELAGEGLAQIGSEGGDAALSRHVVADYGDSLHGSRLLQMRLWHESRSRRSLTKRKQDLPGKRLTSLKQLSCRNGKR